MLIIFTVQLTFILTVWKLGRAGLRAIFHLLLYTLYILYALITYLFNIASEFTKFILKFMIFA